MSRVDDGKADQGAGEGGEAEAFTALRDARALAEAAAMPGAAGVSAAHLWHHAAREGDAIDLRIERHLRRHPGARMVYARALAARAAGFSSIAAAAASDRVLARRLGPHRLQLIDEGGITWLTLTLGDVAGAEAGRRYALEALGADGSSQRIDLGAPIDGVLQVPLEPRFAELARLKALLERPDTAVYLL